MHYLFPDHNPPFIPETCTPDMACIWLLAVMDPSDSLKKVVASMLHQYYERHWLTDAQIEYLYMIIERTAKKFKDRELECMGAEPAKSQEMKPISLSLVVSDGDLIE